MYHRVLTKPEDFPDSDPLENLTPVPTRGNSAASNNVRSAPPEDPRYRKNSRRSDRGHHYRSRHRETQRSVEESANHPFGVPQDERRPIENDRRLPDVHQSQKSSNRRRDKRSMKRSTSLSPASSMHSSSSHSGQSSTRSTSYILARNSTGSTIAFPSLNSSTHLSPTGSPVPIRQESIPEMVANFDQLVKDSVLQYVQIAQLVGTDVYEQAEMVLQLFKYQRQFLLSSCQNRAPSAGTGPKQADKIKQIKEMAGMKSEHKSHLKFIAETVGCMGWIVIGEKAALFIRQSYDYGKTYVRDIKRASHRTSVQTQNSRFIKSWQEVILELEAFVSQWHPHGLVWGKN